MKITLEVDDECDYGSEKRWSGVVHGGCAI